MPHDPSSTDLLADFENVCNMADLGNFEYDTVKDPAIERIRALGPKLLALWLAMQEQFDSEGGYIHSVDPVREAMAALASKEEEDD